MPVSQPYEVLKDGVRVVFQRFEKDDFDIPTESDSGDDACNAAANMGLDESSLMRAANAAGQGMWPTCDDLTFLFSARYNGDAFNESYLQAEYRAKTHSVFTGLVDGIIKAKLEAYASNPGMYNRYAKKLEFVNQRATAQQSNTILMKARIFGIDITKLDTGALVFDVEKSLQSMVNGLIMDHPELSNDQAEWAVRFMDRQLWSGDDQILWRYVSAEELAGLYLYDTISTGVPLLSALDDMIRDAFATGEMKGRNPAKVYFAHLLSDDVINDCINALNSDEFINMPVEWAVNDVIARIGNADDDDWW